MACGGHGTAPLVGHGRAEVVQDLHHRVVRRQHVAAEAADAVLEGGLGEQPQQDRPDPSALVVVEHRDRRLGNGRVVGQADVAGDADARVVRPGGVQRDPGHVVVVVDLGEVADLLVAELVQRRQEAPVARLRRQQGEPVAQPVLVVGPDRAHHDPGAVTQGELVGGRQLRPPSGPVGSVRPAGQPTIARRGVPGRTRTPGRWCGSRTGCRRRRARRRRRRRSRSRRQRSPGRRRRR